MNRNSLKFDNNKNNFLLSIIIHWIIKFWLFFTWISWNKTPIIISNLFLTSLFNPKTLISCNLWIKSHSQYFQRQKGIKAHQHKNLQLPYGPINKNKDTRSLYVTLDRSCHKAPLNIMNGACSKPCQNT